MNRWLAVALVSVGATLLTLPAAEAAPKRRSPALEVPPPAWSGPPPQITDGPVIIHVKRRGLRWRDDDDNSLPLPTPNYGPPPWVPLPTAPSAPCRAGASGPLCG